MGLPIQCSFLLNHVDGEGALVCGRGGRDALGDSMAGDGEGLGSEKAHH